MKVILLAVLCGLAVARIPKSKSRSVSSSEEKLPYYQLTKNREIKDKAFHQGKEYKFVYNGQILTGIPGTDKQHSGSRIQALVTVQFQSEQRVVLQLANVRIAKANREVRNPRRTLPFRVFDEVELDQEHREKLHKPITFTYTNGLVHDISFDQHEQPWSANIKRGVLNLLQVNLQEHHKLPTETADNRNTIRSSSSEESRETTEMTQSQKSRFYRTVEKTMEGECETEYSVSSKPWKHGDPSQPVLNVSKSINFENCKKRPQIKYNWRFSDDCPTCEPKYQEDEKFLKSSTVIRFNITGTSSKFMIEEAEAESQYTFVPMAEDSNVINTYVIQKLEIVKTSPIHTQLQISSQTVQSDSDMIYTVDWDVMKERFFMEGENAFLSKTPYSTIADKVRIIADLLQKMVTSMNEHVEQQAPQWFSRLVSVMRMANREEFEQIHQAFYANKHEQFTPEEHKKIREILVSAVALAGTKDSLHHIIKDIREKRIPEHQQSQALRQLMNVRVVSEQMIHELKTLCDELSPASTHYSTFFVKQSCWLTYASFANALCTPNDDQLAIEQKVRPEKICPASLKEQIVKTLFEHMERAERWEDQLIFVKAISNAGIDTSIFRLEKIIKNVGKRYPVFLRVEAILAMKNIRDQMPLKIQKVLMPVFMNQREHPEIRVTALYEILNTQPERNVLEMITKQINTEPSRHVQSFAYSYMHSLANSTNPCFKNMTHDLKLALRFTKEINTGIQYSKLAHLPFHSLKESLGFDVNFAHIMSNTSLIPFHSALTLDTNWLGSWQRHLLTLGFSSEGLEPMLMKLFGSEGIFSENSFDDYMSLNHRSHPRNTRSPYMEELRQLFQQLKINSRSFPREPKAWFYSKFLGQEFGFMPFSKHFLAQMQPHDMLRNLHTGFQINVNKATILHESSFKIPTTIGFPLVYRHKLPAVLMVKGKLHLDVTAEKPQLVADVKPSFAIQSTHSIEIWSPILNSGLKIRAQARAYVPLKAKAVVDQREKAFKLIVEPPKTPKELLVLETRPVTFVRVWPKTIQLWKEDEEKTIVGEEHNRVLAYERSYGKKYAGVELFVKSRIHLTPKARLTGTPYFPFAGPNKVVVELRPTEKTPEEFEIKAEAIFGTRKSERMSINMKDFWVTKSIESRESSSSSSSSESNSQTVSKSSESHEKRRWNKHRSASKSKSFSSEEFDYNTDKWMNAHELKLEVVARGGVHSNKKLATVQFALKASEDRRRYGKLSMRVEQTPLAESEKWVACIDAEAMYPKSLLVAESMDRKVVAKAELKWGQSCSSDKYVTLKIQAQPSKKQWDLNRMFDDADCQYYSKKNLKSPVACYEKTLKQGRLNQYLFDLEFKNVPSSMRNVTDKLFRYLKYQYYWNTDVNSVAVNTQGKVFAKVTLDPESYQRINVTIKTPRQTAFLKSIPLPFKVRPLNYRRSIVNDFISSITENKYSSNGQAVCKVNDRKVRTFDGTKFRVPISTCYSLLAKDCTEEQRFAVLMKKQSATSQEKKVKILTQQHKIVMFQQGSRVKVEVNGQQYDVERQEPIREHGHTVVRIVEEESVVKVELVEAGVTVYFDGYSANIKMSPIYMGRQCGLCGEYDSESTYEHEYRSPSGSLSRNVRRFYQEFMVRDEECTAPPKSSEICNSEECSHSSSSSSESSSSSKSTSSSSESSSSSSSSESRSRSHSKSTSKSGSKSSSQQSSSASSSESSPRSRETTTGATRHTRRQRQSKSESSNSSEEKQYRKKGKRPTVMRTKVIEETGRTCFSVEKLPHCPKNSYPSQFEAVREVEYQCLNNNDNRVTELLLQVRRGRTVELGQHARKSFTQQERLPTLCRFI